MRWRRHTVVVNGRNYTVHSGATWPTSWSYCCNLSSTTWSLSHTDWLSLSNLKLLNTIFPLCTINDRIVRAKCITMFHIHGPSIPCTYEVNINWTSAVDKCTQANLSWVLSVVTEKKLRVLRSTRRWWLLTHWGNRLEVYVVCNGPGQV